MRRIIRQVLISLLIVLVVVGCKENAKKERMLPHPVIDMVLNRVVYEYVDDIKFPKRWALYEYDAKGVILRSIRKHIGITEGTDYIYDVSGNNQTGFRVSSNPQPIGFFQPICYTNPSIEWSPFDSNGNVIVTTKRSSIDSNGNETTITMSSVVDSNRSEIAIIEVSTSTVFRPYIGNNYPSAKPGHKGRVSTNDN